jgi:hypothetical protein
MAPNEYGRMGFCSLTEVYFLGFSWRIKEGYTETHTKRAAVRVADRPGTAGAL